MKEKLESLLVDLEDAFQRAPVRALAQRLGQQWNYSLATLPSLQEGAPLIVGLNWGVTKGERYEPQQRISLDHYATADRGSLARMDAYFIKLYGADFLSRVCQTNYCFFRTENDSQLAAEDFELCRPIFCKLLEILKPSMMFCFSSRLRDQLLADDPHTFTERTTMTFAAGNRSRSYEVMRGSYKGLCEVVSLPHPNAQFPAQARQLAWRTAFPELAEFA